MFKKRLLNHGIIMACLHFTVFRSVNCCHVSFEFDMEEGLTCAVHPLASRIFTCITRCQWTTDIICKRNNPINNISCKPNNIALRFTTIMS